MISKEIEGAITVPAEVRLEIDDSVNKLAVFLDRELKTGVEAVHVHKLLGPLTLKAGKRWTAKQIHSAMAHIGCAYIQAVVAAGEKYRRLKEDAVIDQNQGGKHD